MTLPNLHTNIMLDLETTGVGIPNPAIIEIGAVHFDINTGDELSHFTVPINLQSCLSHGLISDPKTLIWLQKHIPSTLSTSQTTSTTLPDALSRFATWVETSHQSNITRLRERGQQYLSAQIIVWGNPATSDNTWIASAYRACGMQVGWEFYNNRCVMTWVREVGAMAGRKFAREGRFVGKRHVALDDCRFQVAYLVSARRWVVGRGKSDDGVVRRERVVDGVERRGDGGLLNEKFLENGGRSANTSFSSERDLERGSMSANTSFSSERDLEQGGLSTNTSFSSEKDSERGCGSRSRSTFFSIKNTSLRGWSSANTSFSSERTSEGVMSANTSFSSDTAASESMFSANTSFSSDTFSETLKAQTSAITSFSHTKEAATNITEDRGFKRKRDSETAKVTWARNGEWIGYSDEQLDVFLENEDEELRRCRK